MKEKTLVVRGINELENEQKSQENDCYDSVIIAEQCTRCLTKLGQTIDTHAAGDTRFHSP